MKQHIRKAFHMKHEISCNAMDSPWTSSGNNLKGQLENTEQRHRNTFRNRPLESKVKRQLI